MMQLKSSLICLFIFLSTIILVAQPQGFNYQSVVRDGSGALIENAQVSFLVEISEVNFNTLVYSEEHQAITNEFGLANFVIGTGTPAFQTFQQIDWRQAYDATISIDETGGNNYAQVGVKQLWSVPYAMHAETATLVDDADADPNNEIQSLSISGSDLSISGGNTIALPSSADNLGDHSATQNVELGSHYISGDGDSEGLSVDANGAVSIHDGTEFEGAVFTSDSTGQGSWARSFDLNQDMIGSSAGMTPINDTASAQTIVILPMSGNGNLTSSDMIELCIGQLFYVPKELNIYLKCPNGQQAQLTDTSEYQGGTFLSTCFDMVSVELLANATPAYTGSFKPTESLSLLEGCPIAGDWELIFEDQWINNSFGSVDDISLEINTNSHVQAPLAQSNGKISLEGCPGSNQVLVWNGSNWACQVYAPIRSRALQVSTIQPYEVVSYIIALQGTYPQRNGTDPFIGEIIMFGGNFAPRSWAYCDGQLLSINQNMALFSILGTTFGGDGRTTFALPDFRGRVSMQHGNGPGLSSYTLGQRGGAETQTINDQY